MGKEIKTRQVHQNIKALDKTATAAEHMKRSYVRTKNSADQTQAREHATPEEYAQDRIAGSADILAHKSVGQVKKQGSKVVDTVKEKHRVSKEIKQIKSGIKEGQPAAPSGENPSFSPSGETNLYQPKEERIRQAQLQAGKKAAQQRASQQISQAGEFFSQTIKTFDRGEKTIKTTGRAGQSIKNTGKGTVKSAQKSIKTAQRTGRTTVKTTERAVKNAQRTAKAGVKTAEKAAKAAKAAARTAKAAAQAALKDK